MPGTWKEKGGSTHTEGRHGSGHGREVGIERLKVGRALRKWGGVGEQESWLAVAYSPGPAGCLGSPCLHVMALLLRP